MNPSFQSLDSSCQADSQCFSTNLRFCFFFLCFWVSCSIWWTRPEPHAFTAWPENRLDVDRGRSHHCSSISSYPSSNPSFPLCPRGLTPTPVFIQKKQSKDRHMWMCAERKHENTHTQGRVSDWWRPSLTEFSPGVLGGCYTVGWN